MIKDQQLIDQSGVYTDNNHEEDHLISQEISLRPQALDQFAGQEELKKHLKIFISSALSRSEPLDHVLFNGPPGLGKTTLAKIIAYEMNAQIKIIAAPSLSKVADLAAILTNLKACDILFIDEIHRLNKHVEETLYSALEDFKIDVIIGEGPSAKIININLDHFTLVGATTKIGAVSKPLRDRFGIILNLGFYSLDELAKMVIRSASLLEMKCNYEAALEVAKRSRGTPRIAMRLIKRIRDFVIFENILEINEIIARKIFDQMLIDQFGLEHEDRRYLKFLFQNYTYKPVGLTTISAALLIEAENIQDYIEPYLLSIGFLERSARGRILTSKALEYLSLIEL